MLSEAGFPSFAVNRHSPFHNHQQSTEKNNTKDNHVHHTSAFFNSKAFSHLHHHATHKQMAVLVLHASTSSSNHQSHSLSDSQLLPVPPAISNAPLNSIVPTDNPDDGKAFVEQWFKQQFTVEHLPSTCTDATYQKSKLDAVLHTRNHTSSLTKASFPLTILRRTTRDMLDDPLKWMLSGGALVVQSETCQKQLLRLFTTHLLPHFATVLASDSAIMQDSIANMANAMTHHFRNLPRNTFRIAGDKQLTPTQRATRIATQITTPIVVQMLLLTPVSTLGTTVALTALTAGLLAIDHTPNATIDHFGQATTALTLTGGTAFLSKMMLTTLVPGGNAQFVMGSLQFMVASSLTTSVANSTTTQMTQGYLRDYAPGPSLLHTLLEDTQNDFTVLQYKYFIKTKIQKLTKAVNTVQEQTWNRWIRPFLPEPLRKLTIGFVASFTTCFGLYFAYTALPYHIHYLQYKLKYYTPLCGAIQQLVQSNLLFPESKWMKWMYTGTTEGMHSLVYHDMWQPFLDMLLRDHFGVKDWVHAKVQTTIEDLKHQYPWLERVLECKPFATLLNEELAKRWHLEALMHTSVEYLFFYSPLSTFLNLATDTRLKTPTQVAQYLNTHVATPCVNAMMATYDARADVFATVQLAFLNASTAPPTTQHTPRNTDEALRHLATEFQCVQQQPIQSAFTALQSTWEDYHTLYRRVSPNDDGDQGSGGVSLFRQHQQEYHRLKTHLSDYNTFPTHAQQTDDDQQFIAQCKGLQTQMQEHSQQLHTAKEKTLTESIRTQQKHHNREIKYNYLRRIEQMSDVLQHRLGIETETATKYEWTDNDIDTYFTIDELRAIAQTYNTQLNVIADTHTQVARMHQAGEAPGELQDALQQTTQLANRLLYTNAGHTIDRGQRIINLKAFGENVDTLQALNEHTEHLLQSHIKRRSLLDRYLAVWGAKQYEFTLTPSQLAKMDAILHVYPKLSSKEKDHLQNKPPDPEEIIKHIPIRLRSPLQSIQAKQKQKWHQIQQQDSTAHTDYKKTHQQRFYRHNKPLQDATQRLEHTRSRMNQHHRELLSAMHLQLHQPQKTRVAPPDDYASDSLTIWLQQNFSKEVQQSYSAFQNLIHNNNDTYLASPQLQDEQDWHTIAHLDQHTEGITYYLNKRDELLREHQTLHKELLTIQQQAFLTQHHEDLVYETKRATYFGFDKHVDTLHHTLTAHKTHLHNALLHLDDIHITTEQLHTVDAVDWLQFVDKKRHTELYRYMLAFATAEKQYRTQLDKHLQTLVNDAVGSTHKHAAQSLAPQLLSSTQNVEPSTTFTDQMKNIDHPASLHPEYSQYYAPLLHNVRKIQNQRHTMHNAFQSVAQQMHQHTTHTSHSSTTNINALQNKLNQLHSRYENDPPFPVQTLQSDPGVSGRTRHWPNDTADRNLHKQFENERKIILQRLRAFQDILKYESLADQLIARQHNGQDVSEDHIRSLQTQLTNNLIIQTETSAIQSLRHKVNTLTQNQPTHQYLQTLHKQLDTYQHTVSMPIHQPSKRFFVFSRSTAPSDYSLYLQQNMIQHQQIDDTLQRFHNDKSMTWTTEQKQALQKLHHTRSTLITKHRQNLKQMYTVALDHYVESSITHQTAQAEHWLAHAKNIHTQTQHIQDNNRNQHKYVFEDDALYKQTRARLIEKQQEQERKERKRQQEQEKKRNEEKERKKEQEKKRNEEKERKKKQEKKRNEEKERKKKQEKKRNEEKRNEEKRNKLVKKEAYTHITRAKDLLLRYHKHTFQDGAEFQDVMHALDGILLQIRKTEATLHNNPSILKSYKEEHTSLLEERNRLIHTIANTIQQKLAAQQTVFNDTLQPRLDRYGTLSEKEKRLFDQQHQRLVDDVLSLQNTWKELVVPSETTTTLNNNASIVSLHTRFALFNTQIIEDTLHSKHQQQQQFYQRYIEKSNLHTQLHTIDTLKHFGRLSSSVSTSQHYDKHHRAFLNADQLKRHLKEQLHVGETHMMSDREFEQQFNWDAPSMGFETQIQHVANAHAITVTQMIQKSVAMQTALGVRNKTFLQSLRHITRPESMATLHQLHTQLHRFHSIVHNIEGYQGFELGKHYDTVEQKYMDFKKKTVQQIKSWFNLKYLTYETKHNMLDAYKLPSEFDFEKEERRQLNIYATESHHLHNIVPNPLHRRMHLLMVQRKGQGDSSASAALEHFALHNPQSFAQFMETYDNVQDRVESNLLSSRNTYDWSTTLFDTCSNVLELKWPVDTDKVLSTNEIKNIEQFYSNPHIRQLLTLSPESVQHTERTIRQRYQQAHSILHTLPRSVIRGDSKTFWHANANANYAHYGEKQLFDGTSGYKRWLSEEV